MNDKHPAIKKKERIKRLAAWIAKMEESGEDKTKPALYLDLLARLKKLSIDKIHRQWTENRINRNIYNPGK